MSFSLEDVVEAAAHVDYVYEELAPELRENGSRQVVCLGRPKGAEFYVVREYLTRGDAPTWTEGIEKCMCLGAAYEVGSEDAQQQARRSMLLAIVCYGAKMLKGERKEVT